MRAGLGVATLSNQKRRRGECDDNDIHNSTSYTFRRRLQYSAFCRIICRATGKRCALILPSVVCVNGGIVVPLMQPQGLLTTSRHALGYKDHLKYIGLAQLARFEEEMLID